MFITYQVSKNRRRMKLETKNDLGSFLPKMYASTKIVRVIFLLYSFGRNLFQNWAKFHSSSHKLLKTWFI